MFYSGHLNLSAPRGIAAETLCRTHRCAESLSAGSIGLGYLGNITSLTFYPEVTFRSDRPQLNREAAELDPKGLVLSGRQPVVFRRETPWTPECLITSIHRRDFSFGGSGQDHAARGTPPVSAKGGAVPPPNANLSDAL